MLPFQKRERGQALVIVAIALVALLIAAGLAIDGGTVFLERRRMQNAADASALSGTRTLLENYCNDNAAGADVAVHEAANTTAEGNGVEDTDGVAGNTVNDNVTADYVDSNVQVLGPVGGGVVPVGASGISVTVRMQGHTSLMMLLGIDTLAASANAVAMTGPSFDPLTSLSGGLLPIGFHLEALSNFEDNGGGAGDPVCVIDKEDWGDKMEDGEVTTLLAEDVTQTGANRGWLHLGCIFNQDNPPGIRADSCNPSNNIMKGWIVPGGGDDFMGTVYAGTRGGLDGDWIKGNTGARSSAFMDLDDLGTTHPDTVFYCPIFDQIYGRDRMNTTFGEHSIFQGQFFWYHVVGFIGFKVNGSECGDKGAGSSASFEHAFVGEGPNPFMPSSGYNTNICDGFSVDGYIVALWR